MLRRSEYPDKCDAAPVIECYFSHFSRFPLLLQEILRVQQLSDGAGVDELLNSFDEAHSPTAAKPEVDSPRVAELRQLAAAYLAGLRKRQAAENKLAAKRDQELTENDQEQIGEEVAASMRKGFFRAHRQMMQSLAEERKRQHERLKRKLQRSRVKRTEAREKELCRDLDGDERLEIETTLAAIYERERVKLDDNFDEQELQAILK